MAITLTMAERASLDEAASTERQAKVWRRYRAILLAAEQGAVAAARAVGCSRPSVYLWLAAFRRAGVSGLAPRWRARPPRLAGPGAQVLTDVLQQDPQMRGWHATGWTVPLLREELVRAGHAVSERTVRRMLHRLGWRWKRPKYVLGRPDPAYSEKRGRSRRVWRRS